MTQHPLEFHRTNTNDLMATTFPDLKAIVPGYVYAGFTALAGRQKLGKTWLGIDWAIAVATGGVAMGSIDCVQGDVLYIDMENGPRRIQSRIRALFPHQQDLPDMSRLEWVTDAPQLDKGFIFIDRLERWRLSVSDPRLVVIDVLQRIKPPGNKHQNAYESDYSIWAPLQKWAITHDVAVLGLHHTKKGGADDPLEAFSGSNGLGACIDTGMLLDKDQNGRTLYVRGRDVEEKETALRFAGGAWSILGEAADVRRSDERSQIIATLEDHGSPMTPAEIATATGKLSNNIRVLLFKMAKAGEVYKVGGGRYWTDPDDPGNGGNTGNAKPENPSDTAHTEDEGITEPADVGNAGNSRPVRQIGEISRRHKCWHCHKRGETVELRHDFATAHVHVGCINDWVTGYDERNKQIVD